MFILLLFSVRSLTQLFILLLFSVRSLTRAIHFIAAFRSFVNLRQLAPNACVMAGTVSASALPLNCYFSIFIGGFTLG